MSSCSSLFSDIKMAKHKDVASSSSERVLPRRVRQTPPRWRSLAPGIPHGGICARVGVQQPLRARLGAGGSHCPAETPTLTLFQGVIDSERMDFELLPDDERQCIKCKTTCFMSAVSCACKPGLLVCLHHVPELCSCPPGKYKLR